jgi:hypothetical protein
MKRPVESAQRKLRLLALKVDGTGTASLGGPSSLEATLTDNGTGDYTITFDKAFTQVPVVTATCLTADCNVDTIVPAVGSVQITLVDNTDGTTAKDGDTEVIIVGADVSEKYDA